MTEEMIETNVWKVVVTSEDSDDEITFYLAASDCYDDALEVFKQYKKEYDIEGYSLIEMKYMGVLYVIQDTSKEAQEDKE